MRPCPRRSWSAHSAVIMASIIVSWIGSPSMVTMSVVRCGPTLRTSIKLRPDSVRGLPDGLVKWRSGFRDRLTVVPSSRRKLVARVPRINPSQLR